jgi:hypothetical protein
VCNVSFIVYVALCAVFCLSLVCYCVCCVLLWYHCHRVETPFAVELNNNNQIILPLLSLTCHIKIVDVTKLLVPRGDNYLDYRRLILQRRLMFYIWTNISEKSIHSEDRGFKFLRNLVLNYQTTRRYILEDDCFCWTLLRTSQRTRLDFHCVT